MADADNGWLDHPRHAGMEEFCDLLEDPYEHANLLDEGLSPGQEAQLSLLREQFSALRSSETSNGRYTVER